ncbi:TPA: hypothetical protein DCX15_02955 [bacterium]|nr:hypothetical protein [bacterium]
MILGINIRSITSAAVHIPGGTPRILFSEGENRIGFPTHIIFDSQGDFLRADGRDLEEWSEDSGYVLYHFKNIIGCTYDEIQDGIRKGKRFFYEYKDRVVSGSGGIPLIRLANKTYSPEKIMTFFLGEIRRSAEAVMDEPVDEAVICIPAHFGFSQREAMKKAGLMIFRSVDIIEEPLAAILGCKLDAEARERPMMVFAMGAGTLEVVIAKIGADEVGKPYLIALNKPRSKELGGLDMDYTILEYLMNKNRSLRDNFPAAPLGERRRFVKVIEEARISLSSRPETRIVGVVGKEAIEEFLIQNELEEITADLLKDCENVLRSTLEEANFRASEVGHLILVGDVTRMPAIHKMLNRVFAENTRVVRMLEEKSRMKGWDPWPIEIVAKGAAIYPSVDYKKLAFVVTEVIIPTASYTYGFFYDKFIPLIYKGDAFNQEGVIRRETTAIFPRPDGQIPVILREEIAGGPLYQCMGVFSFFLPLTDTYQVRLGLELTKEELKVIGCHHAVGEIVYPHISTQIDPSKEKNSEVTMLKDIQTLMRETSDMKMGYYATLDIEAIKRRGEDMLKMVQPYLRVPEIVDISSSLSDALYQLKRVTDSGSRLRRQIDQKCVLVLNLVAEAGFVLLMYNLLSPKEYRGTIRLLHQVYRLSF